MIKKIMDNKIISGVTVALFSLLMAWGIWVTNGNFKTERVQGVSQVVIENVRSDVEELKKDTKEVRAELKEQRGIIYQNQEKILEKLGSMNRMQESIHKSFAGKSFMLEEKNK